MQKSNSISSTNIYSLLESVVQKFIVPPARIEYSTIGQGNINDTYVIRCGTDPFILQKINADVFPVPERVADNSARVSSYIHQQPTKSEETIFPEILLTLDGKNYCKHDDGSVWRAQKMIGNGEVFEYISNTNQAVEIGQCLARFHQQVAGLSPDTLEIALPGFHHLPGYLHNYDKVLGNYTDERSEEIRWCIEVIEAIRSEGNFFIRALEKGELSLRVVHGDPKVSNIIFDRHTGKALTVIDLDTVGPGLVLQDIGDSLRSCCLTGSEDGYNQEINCNIEILEAVLCGYSKHMSLSEFEKEAIYNTLRLITFEIGLRFFTDYLAGDVYFKTTFPKENLQRACNQFKLVNSITRQRDIICSLTSKL